MSDDHQDGAPLVSNRALAYFGMYIIVLPVAYSLWPSFFRAPGQAGYLIFGFAAIFTPILVYAYIFMEPEDDGDV